MSYRKSEYGCVGLERTRSFTGDRKKCESERGGDRDWPLKNQCWAQRTQYLQQNAACEKKLTKKRAQGKCPKAKRAEIFLYIGYVVLYTEVD